MAVYMDQPLSDEALFSVIARYLQQARVENSRKVLLQLFGEQCRLTVAIARDLERLAKEVVRPWGLSSTQIKDRLTLFPFYAAVCDSKEKAYSTMLLNDRPGDAGSVSLGALGLRYCESCWAEDLAKGRPRYWRRAHQLPGVVACWRHRRALFSGGSGTTQRILETAMKPGRGTLIDCTSFRHQRNAQCRLAIFCRNLLIGRIRFARMFDRHLRMAYAQAIGYRSGMSVDIERLFRDIVALLGREYFQAVGLPVHSSDWLHRAFFAEQTTPGHALRAVLTNFFINERLNRASSCETPLCSSARYLGDRSHRLIMRGRGSESQYFCTCGLSFRVEINCATGLCELIPTQEGPDIFLAMAILHDRQHAKGEIAHTLGVGKASVFRAIEQGINVSPWERRTVRAKALAHWVELFWNCCGNVDLAFSENYRLWEALGSLQMYLPREVTPKYFEK
ncbi:TniQ family protein [Burkholderia sp. A9]|uniref:TniQ family protein n=1 Tax=Burkholderia sp. A9 TaxID=1365108 RepID=UPI0009DF8694|nr:TniQ family protein [Burkholderia sp. A9]